MSATFGETDAVDEEKHPHKHEHGDHADDGEHIEHGDPQRHRHGDEAKLAHVGHSHAHGPAAPASSRVRRRLVAIMVPLVLVNAIALALLWPRSSDGSGSGEAVPALIAATINDINLARCTATDALAGQDQTADDPASAADDCLEVVVQLRGGPEKGTTATFQHSLSSDILLKRGDRIYVDRLENFGADNRVNYVFYEFQRETPLLLLAGAFALTVLVIGRRHGLRALAALILSMGILVKFMLPAIIAGRSPLLVALVGACGVMFLVMYLSHGVSARTTTAVLGTICSLAITGLLSWLAVTAAHFTGLAGGEAAYVRATAGQIDLKGLLLAGIIIGSLGVIDDVTVTQASAVWELHAANPDRGVTANFQAAMRIGRDHIASAVNTLAFAYAGASLPLMILLSQNRTPLGEVLNGEPVATELVRMLAGSIGLMAAVPITTFLAAVIVHGDQTTPAKPSPNSSTAPSSKSLKGPRVSRPGKPGRESREWQRPKGERLFREDE